jgi:hypothetical protein
VLSQAVIIQFFTSNCFKIWFERLIKVHKKYSNCELFIRSVPGNQEPRYKIKLGTLAVPHAQVDYISMLPQLIELNDTKLTGEKTLGLLGKECAHFTPKYYNECYLVIDASPKIKTSKTISR